MRAEENDEPSSDTEEDWFRPRPSAMTLESFAEQVHSHRFTLDYRCSGLGATTRRLRAHRQTALSRF